MYARNHAICDDNRWTVWVISFSLLWTCLFYFLWNIFSSILFHTSPIRIRFVLFETIWIWSIADTQTLARNELQWYGNLFCSFTIFFVAIVMLVFTHVWVCNPFAVFLCQNFTWSFQFRFHFFFIQIVCICICGFTFIADFWQPTSSLIKANNEKRKQAKKEEGK